MTAHPQIRQLPEEQRNTSLLNIIHVYKIHFTLFLNVLFKDINLSNTRKVTGNCKGMGVGVASRAKFVRENIYARTSSGVGKGVWNPQKVSIGTVSSTVLLTLLKILFLKSLDGYLSCSCFVFAIKYKTIHVYYRDKEDH